MAELGEQETYPQRLYHETPDWVKTGSLFHVRIRAAADQSPALTQSELATKIVCAVQNYHERRIWHCELFLVMPDHIHALLAFPSDRPMAKTIGSWKRYATRELGLKWQENFFDHRIRNDQFFTEKFSYIMKNPVAKMLCVHEKDWPWTWRP